VGVQARDALLMQEHMQLGSWRQQNEHDHWRDMQALEGLILQAAGGVEGLQWQLTAQEGLIHGHAVGLQQVAEWLMEMQASSAVIRGHLQLLDERMDGL
jgi:hypothetical protein